ncbi:MAG: hypothetical protein H6715_06205 [Myxococcales bacterium]|nr:hypothetical protein [Myxococcales bacterium]
MMRRQSPRSDGATNIDKEPHVGSKPDQTMGPELSLIDGWRLGTYLDEVGAIFWLILLDWQHRKYW